MTNEDMLTRLDAISTEKYPLITELDIDALKMAVSILDQESSIRKTLTEEDILELKHRYGDEVEYVVRDMISGENLRWVELPRPKKREPKTGHWVNAKVGKLFPSNDFKCSECGNILDFNGVNCGRGDANYCPNCGADMRGEE